MVLFLAVVRVSSAKLANNLNSSLWFWSLLFIIYFLSAPALILQVKPWPHRSHQECPHAGIWFPKVLNARSPSWRQRVLRVVSPSPKCRPVSSTLGASSLKNYGTFVWILVLGGNCHSENEYNTPLPNTDIIKKNIIHTFFWDIQVLWQWESQKKKKKRLWGKG